MMKGALFLSQTEFSRCNTNTPNRKFGERFGKFELYIVCRHQITLWVSACDFDRIINAYSHRLVCMCVC